MKQFKGYDEAKKAAQYSSTRLPKGAYICEILEVSYQNSKDSSKNDIIKVRFDIADGEYKGFFQTQYDNNTNEDRTWKGKVNIFVPFDDGSEEDKKTKRAFANWPDAIEKSNLGYIWDWREAMWKGKKVGIVFGTTGTVIDGKEITYTEARFPIATDLIKTGKAPKAKFKAKNGYTGADPDASPAPTVTGDEPWMQIGDNDEGLPFA